jgi:hypothetical protein
MVSLDGEAPVNNDYIQDYVDFNSALAKEFYLYHSGQKEEFEIGPIYERYGSLLGSSSLASIKAALEETPDHFEMERARLHRLLVFTATQLLEEAAKELTQSIAAYEARATVEWSGRLVTFQESALSVATEPDRAARSAVYDRRLEVIEASNDMRAERLSKLHSLARSIEGRLSERRSSATMPAGNQEPPPAELYGRTAGSSFESTTEARRQYASYTALYEDLTGIKYDAIAKAATTLASATESKYLQEIDQSLRRNLGIGIEEAERPDATYLLHSARYEKWFPPEGVLRVYRDMMAELGIQIESQHNIVIDSERRPHKAPRAFCCPIRIPEEIKLVISPAGGQQDYLSLLHEAGHAQHYAWTSPGLLPEFKYIGDRALTETYAFLFNNLPGDSEWLSQFLFLSDSADFTRELMLMKLLTIRRYAAKLVYEIELHTTGRIYDAGRIYSDALTDMTRFRTGETEYLWDLDDGFYSADYLRAWAFEVSLREYLKGRFGKRWWSSRKAGSFLKEIWEMGDRYTADQMAQQLGIGPITFEPLADEMNRALA